ncbi:MAG: hypothetical protein AB7K68_03885 [Bacteriovoracia bacterium]
MKLAKNLLLVSLLFLGANSSWAKGSENIVAIWADGQFADFQFTLPGGVKGGIDPLTRKELPGKIGYDNSYLGSITGESEPSLSSAKFDLEDARFGKYELLFFQKAGQKSPKIRIVTVTARGAYYPEGMGKNRPKIKLEKEVKINLPASGACQVAIDYKLDSAANSLSLDFSSPCLIK